MLNIKTKDSPPLHVLPSFSNRTPSSQAHVRPNGVGKQNVLHRPLFMAHFSLTENNSNGKYQKRDQLQSLERRDLSIYRPILIGPIYLEGGGINL